MKILFINLMSWWSGSSPLTLLAIILVIASGSNICPHTRRLHLVSTGVELAPNMECKKPNTLIPTNPDFFMIATSSFEARNFWCKDLSLLNETLSPFQRHPPRAVFAQRHSVSQASLATVLQKHRPLCWDVHSNEDDSIRANNWRWWKRVEVWTACNFSCEWHAAQSVACQSRGRELSACVLPSQLA